LEYESAPLLTNESLTISFDVIVKADAPFNERIGNFAVGTAYFISTPNPFSLHRQSNVVWAQVQEEPVPEPSTFVLLGFGLFSIFALVRKRRRKHL
jgi:hypothetical protein